jgi:hypothetical protein
MLQCNIPKKFASPHSHIYHPHRPDINWPRINFTIQVLLGCDVRDGPTTASGHTSFVFPGEAEALCLPKIPNFQNTSASQEQIFRLKVAVSNSHGMQILYSAGKLFEETICFQRAKLLPPEDQDCQVPTIAKGHNFAIVAIRFLNEVEGIDDIDVPQT